MITETNSDPNSAAIHDETTNPVTKYPVAQNKIALRMIANNPNVMMLNGNVIRDKIGFTNVLMRPSTSPTNSAVIQPFTVIPGIK